VGVFSGHEGLRRGKGTKYRTPPSWPLGSKGASCPRQEGISRLHGHSGDDIRGEGKVGKDGLSNNCGGSFTTGEDE